jgi:hypothetical protein
MKLTRILETVLAEIGENTGAPYNWKRTSSTLKGYDPKNPEVASDREYKFTAEEDKVNYVVDIQHYLTKKNFIKYKINFGIITKGSYGWQNYDATSKTGKTGNLRRVMATVMEIVDKEIVNDPYKENYGQVINISPSKSNKQDMRRSNLYMAYIKQNMPSNAKVKVNKAGDIEVVLTPQKTK